MQTFSQEAIERFRTKTAASADGCINWIGARFKDGYGGFWYLGQTRRAHRIAWQMKHGSILNPEMQVLHRCDNPVCVNVDHLFLGTLAENMLDRDQKGRVLSGENSNPAKLTAENVREIRASLLPATQLAKLYGVTHSAVSMVRRGDTWRGV